MIWSQAAAARSPICLSLIWSVLRKQRLGRGIFRRRHSSGSAPGLPTNLSGVARALTHGAEYFATFIKDAYDTYLGRDPDAQGLAWWTGRMQAGVTNEQLEAALTSSSEFVQQSGGTDPVWVEAMYTDLLEHAPIWRA